MLLCAEPPPPLERPLPPSLLQNCVKLSFEPPQGLRANLARAWSQFDDAVLDECSRQTEYRGILFALCFFHAALQERKKFGLGNLPGSRSGLGWNMNYPFSYGDLKCASQVAAAYLESTTKVTFPSSRLLRFSALHLIGIAPCFSKSLLSAQLLWCHLSPHLRPYAAQIPWDDLRYMVGDIIYGGHVVEAWDRRLVASYLETLLSPELLATRKACPTLPLPPGHASHANVADYIEAAAPADGAMAIGLNKNAKLGAATRAADELCGAVMALQRSGTCPSGGLMLGGASKEDVVKTTLDAVLEGLPAFIQIEGIRNAAATNGSLSQGASPFPMILLQEAERMNALLARIRGSLAELTSGLKGDLAMSEQMEALAVSLASGKVPSSWAAAAYPSLRQLPSWVKNLAQRHAQLEEWAGAPASLLPSVWLPGLFNPATFLTAVLQVAARKSGWALDATYLVTEVTTKAPGQVEGAPREGAYIHGESKCLSHAQVFDCSYWLAFF